MLGRRRWFIAHWDRLSSQQRLVFDFYISCCYTLRLYRNLSETEMACGRAEEAHSVPAKKSQWISF